MTISILRPAPHSAVQDLGRKRHRAFGVPESGALDWYALSTANALVGNPPGAAAIECSLGGISIRFNESAMVAVTGAAVNASVSGKTIAAECAIEAHAGDELEIHGIISGRFYYISVRGGIDVPELMGSRSTYLPGAFGGWKGRRLERGDTIPVAEPRSLMRARSFRGKSRRTRDHDAVRVIRCAQTSLFAPDLWNRFIQSSYRVTTASDRTGYRLDGPLLKHDFAELPSEGACVGSVQVPPDGQPILLMADCPTVGGYPKIAVIITADLPFVAQRNAGESLSFTEATLDEATEALRALTGAEG